MTLVALRSGAVAPSLRTDASPTGLAVALGVDDDADAICATAVDVGGRWYCLVHPRALWLERVSLGMQPAVWWVTHEGHTQRGPARVQVRGRLGDPRTALPAQADAALRAASAFAPEGAVVVEVEPGVVHTEDDAPGLFART